MYFDLTYKPPCKQHVDVQTKVLTHPVIITECVNKYQQVECQNI